MAVTTPRTGASAHRSALKLRYGAYVVAAWLGTIVVSLLTSSGFYDIALRDFGLMLAALTLARLAAAYGPPLRRGERVAIRRPGERSFAGWRDVALGDAGPRGRARDRGLR
jgi:hypothetical protein